MSAALPQSFHLIRPYRTADGGWAFDDPSLGLVREDLIRGADTLLSAVVGDADRATVRFCNGLYVWPIQLIRAEDQHDGYGTYYKVAPSLRHNLGGLSVWLCPALLCYFPEGAPDVLSVSVDT